MSVRKVEKELTARSEGELSASTTLKQMLIEAISEMGYKWDIHLPTFLTAPSLARLLWLDLVYRKALDVPGCLVEFGSQWGASLNTFLLLKQIHELWDAGRRIISFSEFEKGFNSVDPKDGEFIKKGDYSVKEKWDQRLKTILLTHAAKSPIGPERNFEIIPGDAPHNFRNYLKKCPELILSHVHFDLDVLS